MIEFNLSMDFEMGWGDLARVAIDREFQRRVISGLSKTDNVVEMLLEQQIPSTWGIVAASCCTSLKEIERNSPVAFGAISHRLRDISTKQLDILGLLTCPATIGKIADSPLIEIGSHSFTHPTPRDCSDNALQADLDASVKILGEFTGREVVSFIPPQNYFWPDAVFASSSIRYVRHTPKIFGLPYSDPRPQAKIARLWNDFVSPGSHTEGGRRAARLMFLRVDRGSTLWNIQFAQIRRQLDSVNGSLHVYLHPHNLHSDESLKHLVQLCAYVREAHATGKLSFCRFLREVPLPKIAGAAD